MIEVLKGGLGDFGYNLSFEWFCVKQGFKARFNASEYQQMREWLLQEARSVGRKPGLGDRIGILLQRPRDRALLNEQIGEALAERNAYLERRKTMDSDQLLEKTLTLFEECAENMKGTK